jgi:hypothetical protein
VRIEGQNGKFQLKFPLVDRFVHPS